MIYHVDFFGNKFYKDFHKIYVWKYKIVTLVILIIQFCGNSYIVRLHFLLDWNIAYSNQFDPSLGYIKTEVKNRKRDDFTISHFYSYEMFALDAIQ